MQGGQTTYLGVRELPCELSAFEFQRLFNFSRLERELIDGRRNDTLLSVINVTVKSW